MPAQCPATVNIEHEQAMVKNFSLVFLLLSPGGPLVPIQAAPREARGIDWPTRSAKSVRGGSAGRPCRNGYDRRPRTNREPRQAAQPVPPNQAGEDSRESRGREHDACRRSSADRMVARQKAQGSGVMPPRGRQVVSPANRIFSGVGSVLRLARLPHLQSRQSQNSPDPIRFR